MAKLISLIAQALDRFGSLVVLPALALLVTADVILRYGFNSPLSWGLEASTYLLLLFFLLGLAQSFRVGDHISMHIVSTKLPHGVCRLIAIFQAALIIMIFGFIVIKTADEIPFLYSLPQLTPEIKMPIWPFYAFIAFVSLLVILYSLCATFAIVKGTRNTVEEDNLKVPGE